MANEIIPYIEMCRREQAALQRGMNFGLGGTHSVILMSVRPNAPYADEIQEDGSVLIYEGHDQSKTRQGPDPKSVDQPEFSTNGRPTQNGRFAEAARAFKAGRRQPERVRVYEKIRDGIWSYNGVFHLVNSWQERAGQRQVFKFRLEAVVGEEDFSVPPAVHPERRRLIPTRVKREVWERDQGRCVECGAKDDLHFDHIIPYSRGGASITVENVQLLCARHNLQKSDDIR